jgi:hypothetical protein
MDFATRKRYYNRFDPGESLLPEDARNVDLDRYADVRVRGVNWVERLASLVELADKPTVVLFTGLPGSGKSTELKRLALRLFDPNRAHLLPILIDAELAVDLANPVDVPEVIAAIVHGTEAILLEREGRNPAEALEEGYLSRLWSWLTKTDVELTKAEYSIPGGPKLVAEMKTRPTLRKRIRETVAANLTTFLDQAREEMRGLNGRAIAMGFSGVVVLFDSLEKLRGISSNWVEVLSSAERIFAAGAPYLRLPVHVFYTIPPAVAFRLAHFHFLPMIKLRGRDGTPFQPGVDAARELVRRRIPDEALSQLLGPDCERRVAELIHWSGGYPREIVRLLRSALAVAQMPISEDDLNRLISEVRDAYRKIVPAEAFSWLARVTHERYFTVENDGHRPGADLMFQNNVVLRYENGGEWFDLHPAVQQIPGVMEALEALVSRHKAESGEPGG